MKKRYLSAVLGLALSAGAQADELKFRDYVFDFGVGHSFVELDWDSERQLDDSAARLLTAAYNVNEEWSAELFYADLDSKSSLTGASVDGNQFGLKGLYHITDRRDLIVPYLGFGFAELELDGGGFDKLAEFGLVYVAGLKIKVHERIALRLEANFDHFDESHDSDTLFWAGLSFSFGGAKKSSAPIVAQPKPPINDPVIEAVAAAPVAAAPTPVDSDQDGVSDDKDACPGTPAGLKVSEDGCATLSEKASVELHVVFDSGKADLKNADSEVARVVAFMTQYPNTKAVIEGHTDASGDDQKNKALSQRRADAVAAAIVNAGIAAERISAVGYGEEKPVADNATTAGRAQNRRVTAEIEQLVTTKK